MPMAVNTWVVSNIPFARHSLGCFVNCELMTKINKKIASTNSPAPRATLLHMFKDRKKIPNVAGMSKMPCAISDKVPAAMGKTLS